MHFKRVVNSINRPHFLAERDGDVSLLNFCQDHRSMKCRTLDLPAEESSPNFGFGKSIFGYDDDRKNRMPRAKRTTDFVLNGNSRHGLGATDGKIYFLDDSQRTEWMSMWRVDCDTGRNEYTRIPSGYFTRFSDSEYIIHANHAKARDATIYLWKTGENAEKICHINIPNNVADRTRIAYGRQLMFVKAEDDKILITSLLNVITDEVTHKSIAMEIVDKTMRWFCAKNHLLAVVSGRVIFINVHSLSYEIAPTNLDPNGKYHPFAVDSNGFVYILCPTSDGCTVQRARDVNLSAEEEIRVIIPKKEKVIVPKKEKVLAPKRVPMTDEKGNFIINVHFHVTYWGNTIFDKTMRVLCTKPLGDVIRRSPEIIQPPETRLKLFYMDKEELTFRTPNFLRMVDGAKVHAEFVDKDPIEHKQEDSRDSGFFSRAMLDEMEIDTPEDAPCSSSHTTEQLQSMRTFVSREHQNELGYGNVEAKKQPREGKRKEVQKKNDQDGRMKPEVPTTSSIPPLPVADNREADTTRAATVLQQEMEEAVHQRRDRWMRKKLLAEMEWLREYISGNNARREEGQPVDEMELLKKKYARTLMMMGRAETKK
ncbi:hypothetical protein PMAYCL1PPCAC_33221 [Pristionchus mayeri]|uniref:Uncharacterized protein n=1 Tax=Pristionchus mayeri TaxID=1317129 RepID=A0AAN5DHB7_9BILA|nr:hypothetical protein PMAYCL1PPCAC_33221 [Pristionchus mayeri]